MAELTGPEDLEPVEFASIASVHDAPGIDERQLAERMGFDVATARRIAKRLERRGFVAPSPKVGGRLAPALHPTPAALDILQRLRPAIRAAHDRIMAPLSDREREMLLDLLARVIKAGDVKGGGGDR